MWIEKEINDEGEFYIIGNDDICIYIQHGNLYIRQDGLIILNFKNTSKELEVFLNTNFNFIIKGITKKFGNILLNRCSIKHTYRSFYINKFDFLSKNQYEETIYSNIAFFNIKFIDNSKDNIPIPIFYSVSFTIYMLNDWLKNITNENILNITIKKDLNLEIKIDKFLNVGIATFRNKDDKTLDYFLNYALILENLISFSTDSLCPIINCYYSDNINNKIFFSYNNFIYKDTNVRVQLEEFNINKFLFKNLKNKTNDTIINWFLNFEKFKNVCEILNTIKMNSYIDTSINIKLDLILYTRAIEAFYEKIYSNYPSKNKEYVKLHTKLLILLEVRDFKPSTNSYKKEINKIINNIVLYIEEYQKKNKEEKIICSIENKEELYPQDFEKILWIYLNSYKENVGESLDFKSDIKLKDYSKLLNFDVMEAKKENLKEIDKKINLIKETNLDILYREIDLIEKSDIDPLYKEKKIKNKILTCTSTIEKEIYILSEKEFLLLRENKEIIEDEKRNFLLNKNKSIREKVEKIINNTKYNKEYEYNEILIEIFVKIIEEKFRIKKAIDNIVKGRIYLTHYPAGCEKDLYINLNSSYIYYRKILEKALRTNILKLILDEDEQNKRIYTINKINSLYLIDTSYIID